ncbi:MAG: metalloregulator ArsR/SmtB family transcription factor [Cyclobacteriaceae bacterium]|nr:winged helix-turn-helix transcriptional regulator [Cyclobacteriaceae bacterium]MCH8517933.1 metalloregulator ArsR/SmtB family transcription factor [Cyclobacteriaceae bacterium]
MTTDEKLALYAKALAHPIRIQIIRLLTGQACCYTGDLTQQFPIAQSTISQHLRALKEAGLIQGTIERPKVKYCLNRENFEEAQRLFETHLFSDERFIKSCAS